MAKTNLLQIPRKKHTQHQPADPTPTLEERTATYLEQCRQLKREERQLKLQPLREITLSAKETQRVGEYMYWAKGLLIAAQDSISTLRALMEVVHDGADKAAGIPKTRYGQIDVRQSFHPLHGAVQVLELLAIRFQKITGQVDSAEMRLPDPLQEAERITEGVHAEDFGD